MVLWILTPVHPHPSPLMDWFKNKRNTPGCPLIHHHFELWFIVVAMTRGRPNVHCLSQWYSMYIRYYQVLWIHLQQLDWHLQQLFPFGRQLTATITVRDNAHVAFGAESLGQSWHGEQYQTNVIYCYQNIEIMMRSITIVDHSGLFILYIFIN